MPEPKSGGLFGNGQPAFISGDLFSILPRLVPNFILSFRFSAACCPLRESNSKLHGNLFGTAQKPARRSCILSCFLVIRFGLDRPWFEVP
jgi:hypothetical protein